MVKKLFFILGHFHRLIVSIPLFGGLLHAIISLLTIMMFGFLMEEYLGFCRYLITILFSSFFANLMSGLAYPYYVSVGMSGLIFAMLTINISFLINKAHLLGP